MTIRQTANKITKIQSETNNIFNDQFLETEKAIC